MDATRATLIGTIVAALVSVAGGIFTAIANRRGKRDDTETDRARMLEDRRQKDIDTIIETLQEDVAGLRLVVRAHEETIEALRLQNYELRGDRAQLGNEVARLRARVQELEGRVH